MDVVKNGFRNLIKDMVKYLTAVHFIPKKLDNNKVTYEVDTSGDFKSVLGTYDPGFLGFGGLCVAMQTASVAAGLKMKHYLLGKLLQGILCILFSFIFLPFLFDVSFSGWPVAAVLLFATLFAALQIPKKNSRNLVCADV